MREVRITKVMNGYIVKVGCQTLVFDSRTALLVALGDYLENPELVEKRFVEKFGIVAGGGSVDGSALTPIGSGDWRDGCAATAPSEQSANRPPRY